MFRLAGHLGKTVSWIENNMSNKEFQEWQEYFVLEPFVADRLEMMLAQEMALEVNKHIKDEDKKLKIADFMITHKKEIKKKTRSLREQVLIAMNKIKG